MPSTDSAHRPRIRRRAPRPLVVEYRRTNGPEPRPWRCAHCRSLLGVARGRAVELRFKSLRVVVRGLVTTTCRRCRRESDFATGSFVQPA